MQQHEPPTKRCTECGQTKPRDAFHKNGISPGGLPQVAGRCKDCACRRRRARYAADPAARDAAAAYAAWWAAAHPEQRRRHEQTWRERNREHVRAYSRAYRRLRRERERAPRGGSTGSEEPAHG